VKGNTEAPAQARIGPILRILRKDYAGADCALVHQSPFELLVATVLSAQCTDARVNIVTKDLFKKYRKPEDYAAAPPGELENDIRSTGFFNNKAKSLRGLGRAIATEHAGKVPRTMEEMLELPGVARKTANVVLGTAFGMPTGVVVDTHVFRLSHRLGLSEATTPEKVERDLMELVPKKDWIFFGHALILHGRRVCLARKPDCPACRLRSLCPSADLLGRETKRGK
jgi:endonuclease-3